MKKRIIAFALIVSIFATSFSSFAESDRLFPNGRGEFIKLGPGDVQIVVAGDSYSQHFYKDEVGKGLQLVGFSQEGKTIAENHKLLMEAFNSLHKMAFFSISVNDHVRGTHPMVFEKNLREVMDKAVETEKIVFVHTYMHYPLSSYTNGMLPFTTFEYDYILRKLAFDYDNVYYIDMSDCADGDYPCADGIHYSKKFNDVLYERLKAKIEEIRKEI